MIFSEITPFPSEKIGMISSSYAGLLAEGVVQSQ